MTQFDLQALMQQAQAMKERMEYMQRGLAEQKVTASAGAGLVKATATGDLRLVSVEIDPAARAEDVGMLQDLVVAACNAALDKARDLAKDKMADILPPGSLPPGFGF